MAQSDDHASDAIRYMMKSLEMDMLYGEKWKYQDKLVTFLDKLGIKSAKNYRIGSSIRGLMAAIADNDAVTKAYVDSTMV